MSRILSGPIRNRIGYGLKKPEPGPGFIKNPKPDLDITQFSWNYQKNPLYIYIYIYIAITNPKIPHFFRSSSRLPHSLISAHSLSVTASRTRPPSPSLSAYKANFQGSTLIEFLFPIAAILIIYYKVIFRVEALLFWLFNSPISVSGWDMAAYIEEIDSQQ